MKRNGLTLQRVLLACLSLLLACACMNGTALAKSEDLVFSAETCIFSSSTNKFLRKTSALSSLDECGEDEFVTLRVLVTNPAKSDVTLSNPCIRIDGGKKLCWKDATVKAGKTSSFHIYSVNAKYLTPGQHTAVLYASDQEIYRCHFHIGRKWSADFKFPDKAAQATSSTKERSPYLAAWLTIDKNTRYDAYCIDVKADYLPYGTYCCPANFYMDLSSLEKQYKTVTQDGISGYAGLQRHGPDGDYASILSFWDIFCTDASGKQTTIRAKRTYPAEKTSNDSFGNEGTGAHTIRPYDWQAGRWYRMLLKCGTSKETGNTTVEQWFQDLTTAEWTHTCTYDTGMKDSCFIGSTAFFLENYLSKYAGETRSMEIANVRIHTKSDSQWHDVLSVNNIHKSSGTGSWQAGADKNAFYLISTGVTGQGRTEKTKKLTIQNTADGDPLEEIAALAAK